MKFSLRLAFLFAFSFALMASAFAQTRGSMTLYGDVKVHQDQPGGTQIGSLTIVLYAQGGATIIGRTTVPVGGRYRFNNIPSGEYELAVEADMTEIARLHVSVAGRPGSDYQQDLELAMKSPGPNSSAKASTVSANDLYKRSTANQSLFDKSQRAIDDKKYDEAVASLTQIVNADVADFQAWTELGTTYMLLNKKGDAEKSYQKALEARPTFNLALLNLGRLRVGEKKYDEAIAPLTMLVENNPSSADGNLYLGEAYLQIKKGSKAVGYLSEAARLGRPEAHLRLAALYDAVGMKDKAAAEYERFLEKKPDYPDKKKLQKYISDNKKP
jgi:Tfp pilus assembly protein PilF